MIAYRRLFFANISGRMTALDAESGKVVWRQNLGYKTAASPAVGDGVVYMPLMSKNGSEPGPSTGAVVAFDADTGKEIWRLQDRSRRVLAAPPRRSPLLRDLRPQALRAEREDREGAVVVRDRRRGQGRARLLERDDLHGLLRREGLRRGRRHGEQVWSSSSRGGILGSGNFYATPAVAYGRVFIGNTDGRVYAYGAKTGHLLWAKKTGGYVYSSAAIADRTVYVGSYDKHLYALDAATGDVKWSFAANGEVSGAPTVMEGRVYFSTFARRTYALDERNGQVGLGVPGRPLHASCGRLAANVLVGQSKLRALVEE